MRPAKRHQPLETKLRSTSFWFALVALACLYFADIEIIATSPGSELEKMGLALLQPSIHSWPELISSVMHTFAFTLEGMTLAVVLGGSLALLYKFWWIRSLCAFLRAIHELFWALIFIQCFGLSPLTGVLALAIPYAGTLAKIYGELFEETNPAPRSTLLKPQTLSGFLFTTLPQSWRPLTTYTSYRLECALRSSIILGFIGLPTLGFHLESALREGHYQESASLLYTLIAMVVSLRYLLRKYLLPLLIIAAFYYFPPIAEFKPQHLVRFLTTDIIPAPVRAGWDLNSINQLSSWLIPLWQQQIQPGLVNTLIVSQIALVSTAILSLIMLPLNSTHFFRTHTRLMGDSLLIVLRTLPEYLLAFIFILICGPSMLPAIIALTLHNAGILGHLLGKFSNTLQLRDDSARGLNRYAYEIIPRVYRHFMALLLYRWEIIMRESAILGILGVTTLGFYVDSAFEELRFDRAALLILIAAILNIVVDVLARYLRRRLHLNTTPETL